MANTTFHPTPSLLRRTPSVDALQSAYRAYQAVPTPTDGEVDELATLRQRHDAIARRVDTFVRGESPREVASLAERLLLQNFVTDLPQAFTHTVRTCVEDRVHRLDPHYSALVQYKKLSSGLDLNQMAAMAAQGIHQKIAALTADNVSDGLPTLNELTTALTGIYHKFPWEAVQALDMRKIFTNRDLLVLIRAPNLGAVAEGHRSYAQLHASGGMNLTAQVSAIVAELPQVSSATAEKTLDDQNYADLLEVLGGRALFTQMGFVSFPAGTLTAPQRNFFDVSLLLAIKPYVLSCYQQVDVAAYKAYAASTNFVELQATAAASAGNYLTTWGPAIETVFQRSFGGG